MKPDNLSKQAADVQRTLRHMKLVLGPLESDVEFCRQELEKNKLSQTVRRIAVRVVSGYVEATIYHMKVAVLKVAPIVGATFTKGEMEALTEQRTVGTQIRPKFIPLADNMKLALNVFAKLHGVSFTLDTTSQGYRDMLHLIEVRNRVTHPKKIMDIDVNNEDLRRTVDGLQWFDSEYSRLMTMCNDALPQLREQLDGK